MSPMKPLRRLTAPAARPSSGGRSPKRTARTSTSSSATSSRRACREPFDAVERRAFLKLMGASLALAGMAGCTRQPPEQILPVRAAARRHRPGPAAVLRHGDDARRTRDRPARREPRRTADEDRRQPAASGEPRRDRRVRAGRAARSLRPRSHADADPHRRDPPVVRVHRRDAHGCRPRSRPRKGAGLRILTETVCSPTLAAQIEELLARFPAAVAPVGSGAAR